MTQINPQTNTIWRVDIIESEAGWGQRVEGQVFFDNYEEAKDYIKEYNKFNVATATPDWYMFASGPMRVL